MTYKELKQKLFDATQILMELYQDIAARAEPFSLHTNSELKKTTTSWRSQVQRKNSRRMARLRRNTMSCRIY